LNKKNPDIYRQGCGEDRAPATADKLLAH